LQAIHETFLYSLYRLMIGLRGQRLPDLIRAGTKVSIF